MKLNAEEIFIGAMLQFPLYFIVGWWIIPIQLTCGVLWAIGGAEGGTKLARRIGIPFVVCFSSFVVLHEWVILLAMPFMVWLCPSYGGASWLFKLFKHMVKEQRVADFLTRTTTYVCYWLVFFMILLIRYLLQK